MKIEKMPFYWRLKRPEDVTTVPELLPFCFDYDPRFNLLIQKRDPFVLNCLREVYLQDANIGYLQGENQIARPYGEDFYQFITNGISSAQRPIRSILEIGCGGCALLVRLQRLGFTVIGVDPGPLAVREGAKYGIPIVQDFFPSSRITEPVDLIFHNDVLEHVECPVDFLSSQREQLVDGGLLAVGVPDCSGCIALGDISMAMHQHLSYFDQASLRNVLTAAGFEIISIQRALYGGSLYALARAVRRATSPATVNTDADFSAFLERSERSVASVTGQIRKAFSASKGSVGFYVPLRALPYLSSLGTYSGYRFFDDTEHWYGRFFDGINIPIENFSDLKSCPVDVLFVMSSTFGQTIANKIVDAKLKVNSIFTLDQLVGISN